MSRKKQERRRTAEQQHLLEDYRSAQQHLRDVRAAFEQVTDPELISACVYEVNAAQMRCSYLIARLREEQVTDMCVLR